MGGGDLGTVSRTSDLDGIYLGVFVNNNFSDVIYFVLVASKLRCN